MTTEPDPTQPVLALAELAEIFGVAHRTAWLYTKRKDFPKPYATLTVGQLWKRSHAEKWRDRQTWVELGNGRWSLPPGRPPDKKRRKRG